jgi:hypothetical protein
MQQDKAVNAMAQTLNWITEKKVSEMTDLAVQTLRNWRHLSKGPAYSKIGRAIRYNLDDVENYFRQRRVDPETR